MTVKKGTNVTWQLGRQGHAQRRRHRRGRSKFAPRLKTTGTYRKKVTKAGTYTIVCTIHQPDMKMTLKVTR